MKIKGRQHGGVKSFVIFPTPLSQQRQAQTEDSTSAAGILTKGSRKPANEPKYTGKCDKPRYASCHIYPSSKSKDKAKRTMKLRSDSGVNSYPVGISTTKALAYLANEESYDDKDEYDGAIIDYDNED